ncbi:MAG: OmpH family outer membrane protein [Bacteroidales bacterium]|nr:OmpH family outer membrane protein [Bacteroidales bacterium]
MKRLSIIIILVALLCPFASFAQQKAKFGHIDYGEIIKVMPGIDTVQKVIADMQAELQATGEDMAKEFQKKQEEYQQLASKGTSSPAVLKIKEDELTNMYQRIQDFSQSAEQDLQAKQLELLKPFQEKILNAIKEVGKEHNFTYIFDTSTLTYYEQGEDVAAKVKQKLGIK